MIRAMGNRFSRRILVLSGMSLLCGSLSGCATLLRGQYNGDGFFPTKTGVNVVSNADHKDAKVAIDGKEVTGRLIYEGDKNGSPFYVRRFLLENPNKDIFIKVTTNSDTIPFSRKRDAEQGWWFVGGLMTLWDLKTGALYTYDDVVVEVPR